jgi:serine/threonine protein kinase
MLNSPFIEHCLVLTTQKSTANRPANILLSEYRVPVLVDFGFAEKYDLQSGKAFHSNLMYGTPEVSQKLNHYSHSVLRI